MKTGIPLTVLTVESNSMYKLFRDVYTVLTSMPSMTSIPDLGSVETGMYTVYNAK